MIAPHTITISRASHPNLTTQAEVTECFTAPVINLKRVALLDSISMDLMEEASIESVSHDVAVLAYDFLKLPHVYPDPYFDGLVETCRQTYELHPSGFHLYIWEVDEGIAFTALPHEAGSPPTSTLH